MKQILVRLVHWQLKKTEDCSVLHLHTCLVPCNYTGKCFQYPILDVIMNRDLKAFHMYTFSLHESYRYM